MNAPPELTPYRALFERSIDAVLFTAPDGSIFAANPAACEMLGRTEEEIRRVGRAGVVDPSSPELGRFLAERTSAGKARAEMILVRGDGTRFPAEVSSSQFSDPEGHARTVLIVRDITERRRAEETLANSQALLDSIVNSTHDLIWSVDPTRYGLLWYNRALDDYFRRGRHMEISVGMRPEDLFTDQTFVAFWRGIYARTLRDGPVSVEYEVSNGSRVLQLNLNPLKRDGVVTGVSVFGRDITRRKQSERMLAESEARYRSVVTAMAEGVAFQAQDGSIIAVNPAAERIEGRSAEDMIGHASDDPMWAAVREDGSPFPGDEHPSMVTLRTGQPQSNVVMGIRQPSGERRWISINSAPLTRPGDALPYAVVTTFHDITEKRRAQHRIDDYVAQLEATMRQTLQILANTVEMRDPYTSGHSRRVGIIAGDIAREMGWTDERCQNLQLLGLVHDIGKIAIPAEILTKPGKLGPIEYRIVQAHSEKGYEILKDVSFPIPVAEIIYQHHERLDGSGYPRGLKGDEIVAEARILAVADVLESMASHRPYRPALGIDIALQEIEAHRGTQYDAAVVDAAVAMIRQKNYQLPD